MNIYGFGYFANEGGRGGKRYRLLSHVRGNWRRGEVIDLEEEAARNQSPIIDVPTDGIVLVHPDEWLRFCETINAQYLMGSELPTWVVIYPHADRIFSFRRLPSVKVASKLDDLFHLGL